VLHRRRPESVGKRNPERAMEVFRLPMSDRFADAQGDRTLVARVLAGAAGAADDFFARMKDSIWTACRLGTRDEAAARQAYALVRERIAADGFARLRPFQGGRLASFVAIVAREILIDHLLNAPRGAVDTRWLTFEALFKRQILALIARLYPDGGGARGDGGALEPSARQMDIYQRVSIALAKDDYRLLRTYAVEGRLGRSLRRMVINAAISQHREEDQGRPTLPAAVEKLSALEKLVFRAVHWEREPEDANALLSVLAARTQPGLTKKDIEAALVQVRAAVGTGYVRRQDVSLPDDDVGDAAVDIPRVSGEDEVIERQDAVLREDAIQAMAAAIEGLSDREQLFVRTLLEGSNTDRRSLFGEDNYKLIRQVKTKLLRELSGVKAVQSWRENIVN
jgi:hypothetical protein